MKSIFTVAALFFTISVFSQHPDLPALIDFYESTGGENWTDNSGWVTGVNDPNSNPCDGWKGITCNGNNRVDEIFITSNNLTGSIPESLGEISFLRRLRLSNNNLGGEIPGSLVDLQSLNYLQLGSNNYGGEIPDFLGSIPSLTQISLANNNFSGDVPPSIANLSQLNILELGRNNLTGEIFDIIVQLKNLSYLNIPFNEFEGEIPDEITDVSNLVGILLAFNNFTGEIPPTWGDKSFYIYFNIGNNDFSGCIPSGFNSFCDNGGVIFDNNPQLPWQGDFDKFCETSGSNADQVGAPCIRKNNSPGLIDDNCECGDLCTHPDYKGLMAFYSSTNGFSWQNNDGWSEGFYGLNCDPCTWKGVGCNEDNRVTSIGLISNNVGGSIPSDIKMIPFLEELVLVDNNIGGHIPEGLYELVNLTNLNLDDNKINGLISEELGALTKLEKLSFSINNIEGSIPSSIGMLSDLEILSGYANRLTGEIPSGITNLTKLTTLNLSYNKLIGELPENIGNLSALVNLRMNSNKLSGSLPASLGDLDNLSIVYFQNNNFSGCIDENINKLCDVGEIRFSNNIGLTWNGDFEQFCASSGGSVDQEGAYCGLGGAGVIDDCECIESNDLCFVYEGILCQEWVQELVNSLNCYDFGFGNRSLFSLALSSYEETPVLVVNESWEFASKVGNTNSIYTCDGELLEICTYSLGVSCGDSTTIYSQLFPAPTTFYRCMEDELPDCTMFTQHEDYPALSALYYATDGLNWTNQDGWREGMQDPFSDPCVDWFGVSCNEIGRVDSINFFINELEGELPNEIGDLSHLVFLNLSLNSISGSLPDSISKLKQLKHLDISFANLNTHLNEAIGEVENLEYLNLRNNEIIGALPESIGNLTKLKFFSIEENTISKLPSTVWNMDALKYFYASSNQLEGELNVGIGNLKNLVFVDFSDNNFSGSIPSSISNLTNLLLFNFAYNNLTGELPESIGSMESLHTIYLENNNLSGCFPESYQSFCLDALVSLSNNPMLPWEGNFDVYCLNDADQIGAPCDDGDDTNGLDDVIREDCSCGPKPVRTEDLLKDMKVFPNPTTDILFIEGYEGGDLSYELVDLLGHMVSNKRLNKDGQISTFGLLKGVYILKLIDRSTGVYQTFKIVKE